MIENHVSPEAIATGRMIPLIVHQQRHRPSNSNKNVDILSIHFRKETSFLYDFLLVH